MASFVSHPWLQKQRSDGILCRVVWICHYLWPWWRVDVFPQRTVTVSQNHIARLTYSIKTKIKKDSLFMKQQRLAHHIIRLTYPHTQKSFNKNSLWSWMFPSIISITRGIWTLKGQVKKAMITVRCLGICWALITALCPDSVYFFIHTSSGSSLPQWLPALV